MEYGNTGCGVFKWGVQDQKVLTYSKKITEL